MAIQKTLVVIKPDGIARTLIGEIIHRFERAWLHLVGMKMIKASKELLIEHYEGLGKLGTRKGQTVLDNTVNLMMHLPVVAMVREWVDAVDYVRKLVWPTEPKAAPAGTIRGDFAHMSYGHVDSKEVQQLFNLAHASATPEEAEAEVSLWFTQEELFDHEPLHKLFTR